MATLKKGKISDLLPDQRNANKHSERGTQLLDRSLEQNGLGRSILISNDGEIIAGNGVVDRASKLGIQDVRIIETNGKEIIAVKRTDINSNTKEFFDMALADNIVAKNNIVLDASVVEAIAEEYDVKDWSDEVLGDHDETDITRIVQFGEGVNFNIKCENITELNKLKKMIGIDANSMSFENFKKLYENRNTGKLPE